MGSAMTPLDCYAATAFSVLAAAFDLSVRRIPNVHVLLGAVTALVLAVLERGWAGIGVAAAGALVAIALMLPAYIATAVAGGDVKTMAVIGAFAGPRMAFSVVMVTLIAGGFVALIWLVSRPKVPTASQSGRVTPNVDLAPALQAPAWRAQIPYGPVMAIGALLAFFMEAMP